MNIFIIFSIIFSFNDFNTVNIENDFLEYKNSFINSELTVLKDAVASKKAYLNTINIYDENHNIMLHQYYKFLEASKEFETIIKITDFELNYFLSNYNLENCKKFNKSFNKKLKNLKYNKNNDFQDLLNKNIIDRNFINYFEYVYLFLRYLKEKTNYYSIEPDTACNVVDVFFDNFNKSKFNNLNIENLILETSRIVSNISQTHNTFITWYHNDIVYNGLEFDINNNVYNLFYNTITDDRNIEYSILKFFYKQNIFDSYLKVNNLLSKLEKNIFSFLNINALIKLKIYKINLVRTILFSNSNSIFRLSNVNTLIDNNILFFSYNFSNYYFLFSDLVSELVYNFNNSLYTESDEAIWKNVRSDQDININFNNIVYNNLDYNSLSLQEQKAVITKSFLNSSIDFNIRVEEYLKLIFSAVYQKEQKLFLPLREDINHNNLKKLLQNGNLSWVDKLNQLIISNTM